MCNKAWILLTAVLLVSCTAAQDRGAIDPTNSARVPIDMGIAAGRGSNRANMLALLVGINKYPHFRDLRGAVNDVKNIKRLLVDSFDFPDDEEHIKVLLDEQATRKAIIDNIRNHLIAKATSDSVVVFHYSGHGSKIKDSSGDEADGYDETLVPYDSGRDTHPNTEITDDEINALMRELTKRTPNVTFIFDSCNSGTASRAAGLARTVRPDERKLPKRSPIVEKRLDSGRDDHSDLRSNESNFVLISGSAAHELSFELRKGGKSFGAMTWFLTDQIRRSGANVTYRDILDIVENKVSTRYPRQHPQLEGTGRDRLVFSTRSVPTQAYALVTPKNGRITLNAGEVHGASVGSIYDVYAPGTKDFTGGIRPVAQIKVTGVDVTTAFASIIEGGSIEPSSRAIEREHHYSNIQLQVHFKDIRKSAILQKVKSNILAFKHIKIVDEDRDYDVLLRENNGFIITEAGDPSEIAPPIRVSDSRVVSLVTKQLTQWAKWFNILKIQNLNPNLAVEFDLDTQGETTVLREGTEFNITIKNNSSTRLYPALLDLSSDGQVQLIFPESGEEDFIAAGNAWSKRLRAILPNGRDSVRDILKFVATTKPTDYRFLEQRPIRGMRSLRQTGGRARNPLEELIANAAISTSRAAKRVEVGDWVTVDRVITVNRSGTEL